MSVNFSELRELLLAINQTDISEFTLKSDDFEVVVVNDGSTDSSQSIIDEFVNEFPGKFRTVSEFHLLLAETRVPSRLIPP